MDAKQCDRCGEYFNPSAHSECVISGSVVDPVHCNADFDLCPACTLYFRKWWALGSFAKHRVCERYLEVP